MAGADTGQPDSQGTEVDGGIEPVFPEAADGRFEEIF